MKFPGLRLQFSNFNSPHPYSHPTCRKIPSRFVETDRPGESHWPVWLPILKRAIKTKVEMNLILCLFICNIYLSIYLPIYLSTSLSVQAAIPGHVFRDVIAMKPPGSWIFGGPGPPWMLCILLLTLTLPQAACSPPGPNSGSLVGMVFENRSGKEQGYQTA